jgi:uncharacterized OB-fold protein
MAWTEIEPEGTLHSWTEVQVARGEFDTPYLLGLVDLPQGLGRIVARIVNADTDRLRIGQPVKINFVDVDDDFTLYCLALDE